MMGSSRRYASGSTISKAAWHGSVMLPSYRIMAKTYAERLKRGLTRMGYSEDKNGRSKYAEFVRAGSKRLFVGPAGALRAGDCATRSHSMGDPVRQTDWYKSVLAKGDEEEYA